MPSMKPPSNLENLQINEIFYTIQGEGLTAGKPSIFIRLSGCNLRCIWCDTKYTWLYNQQTLTKLNMIVKNQNLTIKDLAIYDKKTEAIKMKLDEVIKTIKSFNCTHLVITGGEPLLQKERLIKLLQKLPDYSVEIETNGTVSPKGLPSYVKYNVSPKLSNSFNSLDRRYNRNILREFLELNSSFKYVISKPEDLKEVLDQLGELPISQNPVILMPEATDEEMLKEKQQWLIELCKKYNFHYSNRLHIQIYGSKRGV